MECIAKCRLCGKEITFKNNNVYVLGEHLIKNHPDIEMTHFFYEQSADGDGLHQSQSKSLSKLIFDTINSLPNLCKTNVLKTHKTTNLFKTTVEMWSPGSSPLTCPSCKNHDQPYIRKQKNKVASNSLGAYCLLGCWPLCFLPMVMCGTTTTSLCCRKCGYCFGFYDANTGKPATKDTKTSNNKTSDNTNNKSNNKDNDKEKSGNYPIVALDKLNCDCCL